MSENVRLFARYMFFQLPGMFVAGVVLGTLVNWGHLTAPVAWGLFGLWVAKDLALFPVMRIAYTNHDSLHGTDAMIGATATTQCELLPGEIGYVRYGPERWQACLIEGAAGVAAENEVRIVEVDELTLRVEPT